VIMSAESAPALGDIRALGVGTVILLRPGVTSRKDWGRYQDALAQAVSRGASVHWLAQDAER
jgi:hypothetical protein